MSLQVYTDHESGIRNLIADAETRKAAAGGELLAREGLGWQPRAGSSPRESLCLGL